MARTRPSRLAFASLALSLATTTALGGGELCRMQSPEGLIAHEWGTFTSFSTSDGRLMYFNTVAAENLPEFIYTRGRQKGVDPDRMLEASGKSSFFTRQRMETPVIYFYPPKPMSVDVRVDFPRGIMTEFYPPVSAFAPDLAGDTRQAPQGGRLEWKGVELTPGTLSRALPPTITNGSHYAAARAVGPAATVAMTHAGEQHVEKFLFYRGVGEFELPVTLRALGSDRFRVTLSRKEAWPGGLLMSVDQGRVRWASIAGFSGSVDVTLPQETGDAEQAAGAMVAMLRGAGLFELEARAMVETWRRSWFGEEGTRVLALLPGALSDEILPLHITPTPVEMRRAFVARLEILTPETAARIERVVSEGSPARDDVQARLRQEVGWLGRFLRPSIDAVRASTASPVVRDRLGT